MCFVELTTPGSGKKIHVNLDQVNEMRVGMRTGKTIMFFGPNESILVGESIDTILELGAAALSGQRALEVA